MYHMCVYLIVCEFTSLNYTKLLLHISVIPKIIFVGADTSTTAALYALADDVQSLKGLDIMVFE